MNHSRAYTGGPAASGLPRAPTEPSAVLPVPAQPHGFNHGSGYYQPSSLMQVDEGTMVAATDTLSTDAFWKDMMLPGCVIFAWRPAQHNPLTCAQIRVARLPALHDRQRHRNFASG
jgi:hypothetical protein